MASRLYTEAQQKEVSARIVSCASILAGLIESKQEEIIQTLLDYESFAAATDEVARSLDCLKHISNIVPQLTVGQVDLICSFLPVNAPLYSLVMFGIVPGFMAKEIVVRPPIVMQNILHRLMGLLELTAHMPQIKSSDLERTLFREAFVSLSDVVLFTGRYENAKLVQESCPDALFVYNGAGINPVIVTDSADVEVAVEKAIETRIFNGGQDCAGADAVLVHEKIYKNFRTVLLEKLAALKVGDYHRRDVKIGSLAKRDQLSVIKNFFDTHQPAISFGGKIDLKKAVVYPTVIEQDMRALKEITYTEFFAPVFYVLMYHSDADLKRYFLQSAYEDYAMYVSVFGKSAFASHIPNSVVLTNQVINDVERWDAPFGGYGPKANYVSYRGRYEYRPLFIPKEIADYMHQIAKASVAPSRF